MNAKIRIAVTHSDVKRWQMVANIYLSKVSKLHWKKVNEVELILENVDDLKDVEFVVDTEIHPIMRFHGFKDEYEITISQIKTIEDDVNVMIAKYESHLSVAQHVSIEARERLDYWLSDEAPATTKEHNVKHSSISLEKELKAIALFRYFIEDLITLKGGK